jgi:hypothetical protein
MAAQRIIYHWQRELERVTLLTELEASVILCDRGTVDGLAYWTGARESFFPQFGTSLEHEISRYDTVIHLHTPGMNNGYNHENHVRNETPEQARILDERIFECWEGHPNRFEVGNQVDFMAKASEALRLIRNQMPSCCHTLA